MDVVWWGLGIPFSDEVAEFFNSLYKEQERLGGEFEQVILDNFNDLIVKT